MRPNARPRSGTYALAAAGSFLTAMIVLFPRDSFEASVHGLRLWFDVVLPALLPFFVMAEIMMGLGVVHFVGVLLEPYMRPLFRIPGAGAFAVAIGLAAGYPLGAKVTGDLRRKGLCTGPEGERLLSLANTADPLFMAGAVAVGMFAVPELGGALALSHYASVLTVGFIMRFHASRGPVTPDDHSQGSTLTRALTALTDARRQDGRSIGQLFADAARQSMYNLLFVGGSIIMFSVFIRVLAVAGIVPIAGGLLAAVLEPLNVHPSVVDALLRGVVEITNGAKAASEAGGAPGGQPRGPPGPRCAPPGPGRAPDAVRRVVAERQ
ncbi:MAG: hypothetical protein H0Z37_06845 [Firmicutes bacterium]|nr:hypothetical protein [Bacillota bacterium]